MTIASNTGPLIALAKADQFTSVRELLEQIRDRGYWLSDELIEAAAKLAGE